MGRLMFAAAVPGVVCFLLGSPASLIADAGGYGRSVTPANDPAFGSSAEARDVHEPRDMTSPRAVRRALRGRSRDRVAPDHPTPLRDLTDLPVATGSTGLGRRFEPLFRSTPTEIRNPVDQPARVAPAAPPRPVVTRIAPPEPLDAQPGEVAPLPPVIRVADGPPTSQGVDVSSGGQLAVDERRVQSLNKSLQQIGLIEPVDVDGLRPADLASELQATPPPILLTGSFFADAHPQRYLYCFSHNPLYFEEANLERCGIGHGCCQPAVSAAHFVGRAALLPFSLLTACPGDCVTTLGDCPTCRAYPCGADWNR